MIAPLFLLLHCLIAATLLLAALRLPDRLAFPCLFLTAVVFGMVLKDVFGGL